MISLFGVEPYVAALIIAGIGVAVSTVFGWLGGTGQYDPRKGATSAIIATFSALLLVVPTLQNLTLPEDGGLTALLVTAGLIAQIAGIDTLVKSGKDIALKATGSTTTPS